MTTGASPSPRASSSGATALRADLPASLVVFLVAVPLSLGIAVASDAPLTAGLIAAAVGGLVAGALGGSPLQVTGPAAGLTVVVADLVGRFGWGVTCAITVGAGLLQVGFGSCAPAARRSRSPRPSCTGCSRASACRSCSVSCTSSSAASSRTDAWRTSLALPGQLISLLGPATALGLAVIDDPADLAAAAESLPGWRARHPRARCSPSSSSPPWPGCSRCRGSRSPGSLLEAIAPPVLPQGDWAAFAVGVLTIALIASVESLLSAVAVDRMHTGARHDLDRELLGQGAGNTLSGLLGGLPITGVIVRSSTNVAAGRAEPLVGGPARRLDRVFSVAARRAGRS